MGSTDEGSGSGEANDANNPDNTNQRDESSTDPEHVRADGDGGTTAEDDTAEFDFGPEEPGEETGLEPDTKSEEVEEVETVYSESNGAAASNGSGSFGLLDGVAGAIARLQRAISGGESVGSNAPAPGDTDPLDGLYGDGETDPELTQHPVRQTVLEEAKLTFQEMPKPAYAGETTEDAIERHLFDFSYLRNYEEVERYWVNRPYSFVSILREKESGDMKYHITEPALGDYEAYVFEELTRLLRNSLMYQDVDAEGDRATTFTQRVGELLQQHTAAIRPLSVYKLLYYLRRDFIHYDRIDPIMRDKQVEDISCDGVDVPVFVYHEEYRDLDTNVRFDRDSLTSLVTRMAQRSGKHLSVSNPLVDASLPDGSRVQLTFGGDIATRGPNFTIRQFTDDPDTPIDLIKWDTFSVEQMAYFWLAIENNRSLLFAGGTGAGKTTSLNAVSFFIPEKSKVVSIEDTREISLPHQNWIQSLTRESATASGRGEVTMYQQLQTALRQRPEYILVGEIRTQSKVALTFFQAMATGHTAYTTVHSESVAGVINRLENEPLNVPTQMLKELDIISIQRQVKVDGKRVRRNDEVMELLARGDAQEMAVNNVFEWDPSTDTYNQDFESEVLKDVAEDRGWNRAELNKQIRNRIEVLEYLVENDITWYEDVARVIHTFIADPNRVLEQIRSDELSPAELEA